MRARKTAIPKDGGTKVRVLSIPSIRDRVVQGALKLILEPIFERRRATLGANSGFDLPSMIALASSRILEPGARLWKDCRPSVRNQCEPTGRIQTIHWKCAPPRLIA